MERPLEEEHKSHDDAATAASAEAPPPPGAGEVGKMKTAQEHVWAQNTDTGGLLTRPRGRSGFDIAEQNRKQAMERLGVFHPKSEEENLVQQLQQEITQLKAQVEEERLKRFEEVQNTKTRLRTEEESLNLELKALSRKLHESREQHSLEVKRVRSDALRDLLDQVNKGKGHAFEKVQQELMATLQAQLNQGSGELYERVMIAARSGLEKEVREQRGSLYSTVRSAVERDVEQELGRRSGELYERMQTDIRGEIMGEVEEQRAQDAARMEGMEREFNVKFFEALRAELQSKMESKYVAVLSETQEKADVIAEESVNRMLMASGEASEAIFSRMQTNLDALADLEQAHSAKIDEQLENGVGRLKELLNSHQEAMEGSRAVLKELQEQERQVLSECIERAAGDKAAFEASIKAKYESLMEALSDKHKHESEELLKRQIALHSRETSLEQEVLQIRATALRAAEEACHVEWEQTLARREQAWKQEEAQRNKALADRFFKRFESVHAEMEKKLQRIVELHKFADESWVEMHHELAEKARRREEDFRKVCKAVFDKRMDTFVAECDKRIGATQVLCLERASIEAETRASLEARVEQVRAEAEIDKADFAKEMEARMGESLAALKQSHAREVAALARELGEARAQIVGLQGVHAQKMHKATLERVEETFEIAEMQRGDKRRQACLSHGEASLAKHRERILQLWATMDLTSRDYEPFLLEVFAATTFSPQIEQSFERHVAMLSKKAPLLKLVVQREAVKHQLEQWFFQNTAKDGNNSEQLYCNVQKDALLAELGRLDASLLSQLDDFEATFPRERVFWQGENYRQTLERDIARIPGARLAAQAAAAKDDADCTEAEL
ncbi:Uncharacterized protein SCF082_LOCUS2828 [Durusdinium trenchii]|uniref:Uncharacterized protein n=1 Tax=Durusdinium trenchii TaxID=1381693 RepID=A0ABP0HQ19_9DINO